MAKLYAITTLMKISLRTRELSSDVCTAVAQNGNSKQSARHTKMGWNLFAVSMHLSSCNYGYYS